MNVPFLDLSWQEKQIRAERERAFAEIIEKNAYVLGPYVASFEQAFAEYCDVSETVGVSGGTHALTMIFRALGIEEGDEVLMIPTTFMASATGVIYAGGRPVFSDIDPVTRNFDFSILEKSVTPKTKAILPVHLYGQPADMEQVTDFAKRYNLFVVEDACQAHGARYKGKRVGGFGNAAAFSFYPGKNLGAYGDGGAVTTNSADTAGTVRALRNQGCFEKYDHKLLGYNGRLDALQAAVLSAKLPHLDEWNEMRRAIAMRYLDEFVQLPLQLPVVSENTEPVWHLFVVSLLNGERENFMQTLKDGGIDTGIHYPLALHQTPALAYLGYKNGDFPHAEHLASTCVTLPLYPGMSDEQVAYVIQTVKEYFNVK